MSGWISVTEQEPQEGKKILAYGEQYGGTYNFTSVCKISHFTSNKDGRTVKFVSVPEVGGYEFEIEFEYKDLTHWMELPEPPSA